MRAIWIAIIILSGLTLHADPEISSVRFEACSAPKRCASMSRWTERDRPSSRVMLKVVCTVSNSSNYDDEYFLLTTTDYLITPVYAYSINDFEKLRSGTEVSFGQLSQDDDMHTFILHRLQHGKKQEVRLRTVDISRVLQFSHSDPEDSMWPWLIRVNARLIDRQGRTISSSVGILELAPSAERLRTREAKRTGRRSPTRRWCRLRPAALAGDLA